MILGSVSQNGLSIVTWLGGILLLLALSAVLSVITMKTRKRLRLRRNAAASAASIEVISIEVATGISSATGNFDPGFDSSSGEKDQIIPGSILGGYSVEQANPEDGPSEEPNDSPEEHEE